MPGFLEIANTFVVVPTGSLSTVRTPIFQRVSEVAGATRLELRKGPIVSFSSRAIGRDGKRSFGVSGDVEEVATGRLAGLVLVCTVRAKPAAEFRNGVKFALSNDDRWSRGDVR